MTKFFVLSIDSYSKSTNITGEKNFCLNAAFCSDPVYRRYSDKNNVILRIKCTKYFTYLLAL